MRVAMVISGSTSGCSYGTRAQQSHGAECEHNTVDGIHATRFVLSCVRQRVFVPGFRDRLRKKLEDIARREQTQVDPARASFEATQRSLTEILRKRKHVEQNLAFAHSPEQFQAVSRVFEQLLQEQAQLEAQVQEAKLIPTTIRDTASDIEAALAVLDRLADLPSDPNNLGAIGELFSRLNARMFLRFSATNWGNRKVNKVSSGVVTFGTSAAPIPLYEGPTGRRALKGRLEMHSDRRTSGSDNPQEPQVSGREGAR